MAIHLVAIDLDGTLLNSGKQITETTAAILRTAIDTRGVKVVLASARPPRSVQPFYSLLQLDTPMINYNGALVHEPATGRVLLHRPLALKIARQIVALARRMEPDVLVSAEIMDKWYTDRVDQAYLTATARLFAPDYVAAIGEWLVEDVTKLMLAGPAEEMTPLVAEIRRRLVHQVTVVQTEGELIQITHPTASKSQALRVVAAELHVRREEVMAIGDNANDVGMLQWAGVGVAMANASPEALAVADVVTDHHDADGAAHAIRRLIIEGGPGKGR
jgi:Cof subfamily protein (haloacid dehalogenase superfamily)